MKIIIRLGNQLDLVAGQERSGLPHEVTVIGPDRFHAGSAAANLENDVIIWDEEGLRYEVTDRKGRKVSLYRLGEGFSNFKN